MGGSLTHKVKKFFRTFPHLGPVITRFPVSGTFWNAGAFRIVLRVANHYANYAQMLMKRGTVFSYPSHLIIDITNVCTSQMPSLSDRGRAARQKKGDDAFEGISEDHR